MARSVDHLGVSLATHHTRLTPLSVPFPGRRLPGGQPTRLHDGGSDLGAPGRPVETHVQPMGRRLPVERLTTPQSKGVEPL